MQVYALLDETNRIIALNPNDMSGNTGWLETTDTALTEHTGVAYEEMFEALTNDYGIPIYKMVDGYAEPRTAEEIAADIAALPAPAPSKEEQMQAQIDALTIALLEG